MRETELLHMHNRGNSPFKVDIGRDVQLMGDVIFEKPVRLKIHQSTSFGEMIGEDVEVTGG